MTLVVLDTNIFISAFFWRGKPYQILRKCYNGDLHLATSMEILNELESVLREDEKFEITEDEIAKHIEIIMLNSLIVEPKRKIDIIVDDPSDNKFLECAVEVKADYIVSGDKHLRELNRFEGIEIIAASDFWEIIKNNKEDGSK